MDTHETPAPSPAPHPWRSTVAGAAVGGLLAAAVAVPGTWALTRTEDADAPTSVTTNVAPPRWYGAPSSPDTSSTGSDATDAESQGVVLIDTTLTDGAAAGTGLVIDSDGLVLTNYHVVEGSTSVEVTVATDGTTYDAEVVGFDRQADIALLRLDGASDVATVNLDDDDEPAVADEITAVGNADGQGFLSAASGTVVALDRSITTGSSGAVLGEHLTGLIETDASVVGGYSGGALLDGEGEVVGITTAASSGGASESYAVPIEDALAVAQQIESGDESHGAQIGPSAYLGIRVAETGTGLQVAQVESGSAADRAGIAAGDVLTGVGRRAVDSLEVLKQALATYQPGDRATLRWTDSRGRAHHASVALGTSPVA
jgi:S1-C subfamily serine protease